MKQKIEWYREVLELEPNSKVFFPLAKMLAQDGQAQDAISTLQQGIVRHPDHIEARLLFIDLLFAAGKSKELTYEVDKISSLLESYPGFWKAWAERAAQSHDKRDASLALTFLAASIQQNSISWAQIIEYGLKGILGEGGPEAVAPAIAKQKTQESLSAVEVPPAAKFATTSHDNANDDVDNPNDDDDSEEPFSLRTRSMAEILAEQGDLAGALEIYQELIAATASEREKTPLRARAEELSQRLQNAPLPEKTDNTEESKPVEGRNRISDMFEALAQRLEARSLH